MTTTHSVSALLVLAIGCSTAHEAVREEVQRTNAPPGALRVYEGMWAIRDTNLFVRDVGPEDAPTIVVLHGGPGGNFLNLRPLERLAPQFRVVFYDQRGTGASDRLDVDPQQPDTLAALSLTNNVEDLEALRQRLGKDRVIVMGHSWGGSLAVFYAAAYPEHVEKLIVYSGGPEDAALQDQKNAAQFERFTDDDKSLMKARVGALQEAAERGASQDELDRLFFDVAQVVFPSLSCERSSAAPTHEGRAGFWANQGVNDYVTSFDRASFSLKLKAVAAPALLTWGRCEPSPQERLTVLLDHLPNARLVIFENSGHYAMEEEPELFWGTLLAFLNDAPLPARSFRSSAQVQAALPHAER